MGRNAVRIALLAATLAGPVAGGAPALLARVTLTLPGYSEVASSADAREWAESRPTLGAPARIVLLDRPRESWDDPAGALKRLHRLLKDNCPRTALESVPRAPPTNADAAARGVMYCPNHEASGRGLIVVEDVIAVEDRFIVAKLAFDVPPFGAGGRPLARDQRAAAYAALDSIRILPPPSPVLPP